KCDSAQAILECDKRFRTGQDSFTDEYTPNRDMPPSESSEDEDLPIENLSLKATNE
ncbi:unnamed protein product, partial [Rotaria socialis]